MPGVATAIVIWEGQRIRVERTSKFWAVTCPECRKVGVVDEDQLYGRVSMDCGTDGCKFHETINLAASLTAILATGDGPQDPGGN